MDCKKDNMIAALAALAHGARLDVFRYLVHHGNDGAYAGTIAEALEMRNNTLSANLNILSNAGLITSEREGRHILYRADMDSMCQLLLYLMEDCCGGNPSRCSSVLDGVFYDKSKGAC